MRKTLLAVSLTFLAVVSVAYSQTGETIAIKCGRLFDGKSNMLLENQIILVENNRIAAVGTGVQIPANAKAINLSAATVLPCLVDAHTYMYLHDGDYNDQLLKEQIACRAIYASVNARLALEAEGYHVIRFTNHEVHENLDAVLEAIRNACGKTYRIPS